MSTSTPTILLAAMQSGEHIQVGPERNWNDGYDAWSAADADLRTPHGRGERMHAIQGEPVRFYRLREQGPHLAAEFGAQPRRVRSTDVRRTGFVGLKSSTTR